MNGWLKSYSQHWRKVSAFAFLFLLLTFTLIAQEVEDPTNEAVALFNKGQDAQEAGDLKAAIELYDRAIKLVKDFPEAELQRGSAYQSLGNLDAAEAAFRNAVALKDDWSLALANLGALLVRRNKFEEARPILKRAIEVDAENTPAFVALATLLVRTNAPATELSEIYKKIVFMAASAKSVASLWSAKAILENALGEKKAAALSAERCLEIDGKNISMLALLASLSIDASDPKQARVHVSRIESLEPSAPALPYLRARLLVAEGKNSEALKLIETVKEPSKEVLELKARILVADSTDIVFLEKQLDGDARNAGILGRLCWLLRVAEPLRAMEFCRRAFDAEPNNIDHAVGYGAAMLQAKQYAPAAELFQKLLRSAPENYTLHANLATALFQLKRYNEAKVQFHWITEKQPETAVAYFYLAIAHDELGEFADAMANYQLFLRKADPKTNQLEIDKVNLRLPVLQRSLDAGKGHKNARTKS